MDDKINEKLFGQLLCLPQNSLLVDVKELGYENGALAAMDLVHQFQVSYCSADSFIHYFLHVAPYKCGLCCRAVSVRLSVRPSHLCVLSKRLDISANFSPSGSFSVPNVMAIFRWCRP